VVMQFTMPDLKFL